MFPGLRVKPWSSPLLIPGISNCFPCRHIVLSPPPPHTHTHHSVGWKHFIRALCSRECAECSTATTLFCSLAVARVCSNCWCHKPRFRLVLLEEVSEASGTDSASGALPVAPRLAVREPLLEVPEFTETSPESITVALESPRAPPHSFFSQLFSSFQGGKSCVLTPHQRRGRLNKPKYGLHSITGLYYYHTEPGELDEGIRATFSRLVLLFILNLTFNPF